jgi:hypothetical protein
VPTPVLREAILVSSLSAQLRRPFSRPAMAALRPTPGRPRRKDGPKSALANIAGSAARAVEGVWSAHWRKPLSLAEVNQMADTPEVRQHRGERQRGRATSPDLNSSGTLIELRKLLLRNDNSCCTTGN